MEDKSKKEFLTEEDKRMLKIMFETPVVPQRGYKFLGDKETFNMIRKRIIVDGARVSEVAETLKDMGLEVSAQTLGKQLVQMGIPKSPHKNLSERLNQLNEEIEEKVDIVKFLNRRIKELENKVKTLEEGDKE